MFRVCTENKISETMKQLYFLSSFLFFAAPVFSQQKSELGFVVKAGTFTLPTHENTYNSYGEKTFQPGASFSFGAFTQRQLGGHFGISAEILYNFSAYSMRHQYDYRGIDGYRFRYNTEKRFDVHSFMFPMKLHFHLRKGGKFSLFAGAAPTFLLGSHVKTNYSDNFDYTYSTAEKDRVVRKDGSEGIQLLLTAGGQYRIHPYTSVGLEFTGRYKPNVTEYSFYPDYGGCMVGIEPMYTYWMKSVAISLRHNILR